MFILNTILKSFAGDTAIGLINKLSLNDAVKKFHKAVINGSKTFQESLQLLSKLNNADLVNNVSLKSLSENVCRMTQDEIIPYIVSLYIFLCILFWVDSKICFMHVFKLQLNQSVIMIHVA